MESFVQGARNNDFGVFLFPFLFFSSKFAPSVMIAPRLPATGAD